MSFATARKSFYVRANTFYLQIQYVLFDLPSYVATAPDCWTFSGLLHLCPPFACMQSHGKDQVPLSHVLAHAAKICLAAIQQDSSKDDPTSSQFLHDLLQLV